jgi:hypothetical protein
MKTRTPVCSIIDPNHSQSDFEVFKDKLRQAHEDYHIRVAEGYRSHIRSPKRITILVSEAYLTSGGSIHWVKDLEAEVYELCKEYNLDCDALEMEGVDRSYVCRKEGSPGYGRKIKVTQFDNHLINTARVSKEDIPLARSVVHFFTYHFYQKEDRKNGTRYHPGKGVVRAIGHKQGGTVPPAKRERFTLCQPDKNRTGLSGRKIHGVGKQKLPV